MRYVTFRPLSPWVPEEVLMSMSLGARVKYVRTNLANDRPGAHVPYMTHDDFVTAVGASNAKTPITWEKGSSPRDAYAAKIAALTPYRAAAFGAAGEIDLMRELFEHRLERTEKLATETAKRLQELAAKLGIEIEDLAEQPSSVARVRPRAKKKQGRGGN